MKFTSSSNNLQTPHHRSWSPDPTVLPTHQGACGTVLNHKHCIAITTLSASWGLLPSLQNFPHSTMPTAVQKRRLSRDRMKPPASRKPALCATHPSLYHQPQTTKTLASLPLAKLFPDADLSKHDTWQMKAPQKAPIVPILSHEERLHFSQQVKDPRKMTSVRPGVDDPKVRFLKMDLQSNTPSVISPTFMIGLPCGELIEAAHVYEDDRVKKQRDSVMA